MSTNLQKKPTNAELQILKVLWKRGSGTVAQVKEELDRTGKTGYTTVLKLLQIMHEKGLVDREESFRPHVYRPLVAESETQKRLLRDFIRKTFRGSAARMILQALSTEEVSEEELSEIRRALRRARKERK